MSSLKLFSQSLPIRSQKQDWHGGASITPPTKLPPSMFSLFCLPLSTQCPHITSFFGPTPFPLSIVSTHNVKPGAHTRLKLVGSPPQHPALGLQPGSEALGPLRQLRLIERDAQGLGRDGGRRPLVLALLAPGRQGLLPGFVLDPLLPVFMFAAAPGGQDQVVLLQLRDELLPLGDLGDVLVPRGLGLGEHGRLDAVHHPLDRVGQHVQLVIGLLAAVTDHDARLLALHVAGTHLDPDRHALLLPVVVLPPGVVHFAVVELGAQARGLEGCEDLVAVGTELLHGALLADDGNDDGLKGCDGGGKDEAAVVAVDHDHDPDGSGGEAPGRLPRDLGFPLLVLVLDVEHLAEVLPQVVGRGALDGSAGHGDVGLDGGGLIPARELLLLGLVPRDDGHGEEVLVDAAVQLQRLPDHDVGVVVGCVGRVSLLPEELAGAQEGGGVLELPADDVGPLVELEGEVAVGFDPVAEGGVHDGLGGGADGDGLGEGAVAGLGDPGDLGGEALDVVLLFLEAVLGDEEGEVGVLHVQLLDLDVEPVLNVLPYLVTPRPQDVTPGDVVVADHLAQDYDVAVPHGEVLGLLPPQRQERFALLGGLAVLVVLLLLGLTASASLFGGFVCMGTIGRSLAVPFGGVGGPLLLLLLALPRERQHRRFHTDLIQKRPQISWSQHRRSVVPKRVRMDLGHVRRKQTLVKDERDLLLRIVHDREGTDASLRAPQRFVQQFLGRQPQIHFALQTQSLAHRLRVHFGIGFHGEQEQSVFLIFQE
mmetsp:Transcript_16181/g.33201  ORF Transcript_16181/g.33201 Transcript_16181/m.33201 type:complete len:762 (+) Transcript_16181:84-2369(+)